MINIILALLAILIMALCVTMVLLINILYAWQICIFIGILLLLVIFAIVLGLKNLE